MLINDTLINVTLETILCDLRADLTIQGILLFQKGFKDSSDDIMVQCPYHSNGQEKRPSAGIRKNDGIFHCFACGETHSLPEVISYCFGKDDLGGYGWSWLIKKYKFIEIDERKDVPIDLSRNNSNDISNFDNDIRYVSEQELDSYRYYHAYMFKRGLNFKGIDLFDVGYDSENECITFPVRDIDGNTLFVAKRKIKYKSFFYPAGVEKPLYGLYELQRMIDVLNELIICESMIDCILLWQQDFYAVALNGTGNELQINQLKQLPVRKLILATDNDKAGKLARKKLRNSLKNKLITEINFPENRKDIGECTIDEIKNIKNWEVF